MLMLVPPFATSLLELAARTQHAARTVTPAMVTNRRKELNTNTICAGDSHGALIQGLLSVNCRSRQHDSITYNNTLIFIPVPLRS
jgi:hypothetical protein